MDQLTDGTVLLAVWVKGLFYQVWVKFLYALLLQQVYKHIPYNGCIIN